MSITIGVDPVTFLASRVITSATFMGIGVLAESVERNDTQRDSACRSLSSVSGRSLPPCGPPTPRASGARMG
jgi:hypothetical protein